MLYIQHSFYSNFHCEIIIKLLLINPVHGKESLLLLCFMLVIKFLFTSELLYWALLGKWLSLQYKNLVMVPKKEGKNGILPVVRNYFFISQYLQVPYKPERREWKWHSRTKAKQQISSVWAQYFLIQYITFLSKRQEHLKY